MIEFCYELSADVVYLGLSLGQRAAYGESRHVQCVVKMSDMVTHSFHQTG